MMSPMNKLWAIPAAILSANVFVIVFGFATNTGVIGSFAGATFAIMTDPLIFISGILIGIFAPNNDIKKFLIIFFVGSLILTFIFHFIINTSSFMTDLIRFNCILIVSSILFLIKSLATKK
jgi:hypothetical protein